MRALVVITVALVVFLTSGIPMFMHPPTVYTGVSWHDTGALIQPNVVDVAPGSPAYRAGLRNGDVVGCLSIRDGAVLYGSDTVAFSPGPITFCRNRNGKTQNVRVWPQQHPPAPSHYHSDALAALRLAEYALLLICAIILVLGRRGLMTWLFFWYAICGAPTVMSGANFVIWPEPLYDLYGLFSSTIVYSGAAFLLGFTVLVPEDGAPAGWRRYALRFAFASVPLAAAAGFIVFFQTWFSISQSIVVAVPIVQALLLAITLAARLATMERFERARFGWAAFAIAWALVVSVFLSSGRLPFDLGVIAALSSVLTPLSLLYAVLKRHVIDIRFVMSRTLVYAIITTALIAVIGAVDWATSAFLHEARIAMALDALATICIAFALNRVHRWVERFVDLALFRQKYAAEEYLHRLGPTLLDAQREETIHNEIARAPVRALDLSMAAVFRETEAAFVMCAASGSHDEIPPAFDRDHEMVRFLNTARAMVHIHDIAFESSAEIAIPIFQGKRLTGFVLYGPHTDGSHLDPDEIETLKYLCDAAAQAYISITYERYNAAAEPALA